METFPKHLESVQNFSWKHLNRISLQYFSFSETTGWKLSKCYRSKGASFHPAHCIKVGRKEGATSWCPTPHHGWKSGLRTNGSDNLGIRGASYALKACSVQAVISGEMKAVRSQRTAAAVMNTWGKQCPSGGGISSISGERASPAISVGTQLHLRGCMSLCACLSVRECGCAAEPSLGHWLSWS